MSSNFSEKYYGKFRRKGESIDETVKRVDQEVINNNFVWMCERDTLPSEAIINTESYSELCMSHQKSLNLLQG